MAQPVKRSWNGRSREAAMAAAEAHKVDALTILAEQHRQYLQCCGHRFGDVPFRSKRAPGWVYFPVERSILLEETVERLRRTCEGGRSQ